mmetsp:Transcript_32252/g.78438  ORF Transcript_32252/g.78438 Transcript_32252/m.78438 type:complete len:332 (-) Transcript_32252:186-1181(-)
MMHKPHYCRSGSLLGFLTAAIALPSLAFAFAPNLLHQVDSYSATTDPARHNLGGYSTALYASSPKGSGDNEKDESFDVEAARSKLESMMMMGTALVDDETDDGTEKSSSSLQFLDNLLSSKDKIETEEDFDLPPPPPLSTIERDRRTAEIELLKGLDVTDDFSSELWTLWYSERGVTAKKKLEVADSLMDQQRTWKKTEEVLREIIDEYGIFFVEPLNRLATLYYLQSKYEESYRLCLVILKIKPWHFGALSGIVQVCIGMGDRDGPQNPRRKEWVDKQVAAAEEQLKKIERDTKKSFGKPDSFYVSNLAKGDVGTESGIQESDDSSGAWM